MADCPYHSKHELQIKNLEDTEKGLQTNQRDPRVWVAVFSFLGVCFSTVGSLFRGHFSLTTSNQPGYFDGNRLE
ncbi:hypothetical protein MASR1M12_18720 [Erysipelotrichia bacterium]